MFLRIYRAEDADNLLRRMLNWLVFFLFVGNIFLGFLYSNDFPLGISIFTLFLVYYIFQFIKGYRSSPYSLILNFWTVLFILIPSTFLPLLFSGNMSVSKTNLDIIPIKLGQYMIPEALFFLSICWAGLAFGISSKSIKVKHFVWDIKWEQYTTTGLILSSFFALTVFNLLWYLAFESVKTGEPMNIGFMQILFIDSAFALLIGMISSHKVSNGNNSRNRGTVLVFLFLFLAYVAGYSYFAASKGALLVYFNLFFLYVIAVQRSFKSTNVIFLSKFGIVFLIFLMPLLFSFGLMQRSPDYNLLIRTSIFQPADILYGLADILSRIFVRLYNGGLYQFIMLYEAFIHSDYSFVFVSDFIKYLGKNFVNLISPGTIFPESYMPSSNIFFNVVEKEVPSIKTDETWLLQNMNTQPYTIFGFILIIFHLFAPIILFALGWFLSLFYKVFSSRLFRLVLVYLFGTLLSSFGVETNLFYAINLLLSIVFFSVIIHLSSSFGKFVTHGRL